MLAYHLGSSLTLLLAPQIPGASLPVPTELLTRCNSDCVTIPHFSQLRNDNLPVSPHVSQPTPYPMLILSTITDAQKLDILIRACLEKQSLLPPCVTSPFFPSPRDQHRWTLTLKQPGKPVPLSTRRKQGKGWEVKLGMTHSSSTLVRLKLTLREKKLKVGGIKKKKKKTTLQGKRAKSKKEGEKKQSTHIP